MFGGEFPRLFAEVFGDGAKHATFDQHPSVQVVVSVQSGHTLDGQPKDNDSVLSGNNFPAVYLGPFWVAVGHEPDFEASFGEIFWPHLFQILGCGCDRQFKVSVTAAQ